MAKVTRTSAPKIKDVAQLAGVSTATVSRALNNPDSVTEKTRNLVLNAANETGYKINIAARNLRRQKTGSLVVLVPNLGNPFFSEILAGIETQAAAADLSVLIVDTKHPAANHAAIQDYLHHRRTDGVISLDGSLPANILETLHDSSSAPVIFACEWPIEEGFASVRTDNQHGAKLAIDHLISNGHRKIGHVTGPITNVLSLERLRGYTDTLKSHDLTHNRNWIFHGDFSIESGVQAAQHFIGLDDRPSAIFCASDLMAVGLMAELRRQGLATPEDISVISFDDIDIAAYVSPALTTIRQDRVELGSRATRQLIDSISSGEADNSALTIIPVKLIVRDSSAPQQR